MSTVALSVAVNEKTDPVAVQHVRRMRGQSQAHLMRCSDDKLYVVKFQNNPQHSRVLANEMLAARLARLVGLPVPEPVRVNVSRLLVKRTPDLSIQTGSSTIPCESGLQFGSRYVVNPLESQVFDFMPLALLECVQNVETFAGILALDKWICNSDRRQAVFSRLKRRCTYAVAFIDQGNCFNGGAWAFSDAPLRGAYPESEVYAGVVGWESFEPWLSRIENMSRSTISAAAEDIPQNWYDGDWHALDLLVRNLADRCTKIRDLLTDFRSSSRHPFPNWREKAKPHRAALLSTTN
jgi:hypothetical protein